MIDWQVIRNNRWEIIGFVAYWIAAIAVSVYIYFHQ